VDGVESFKLQLLYEKRYGVTDDEALKVFVGESFLSGEKEIWARLEEVIAAELQKGPRTPSPEEVRAKAAAGAKGAPDALARERFDRLKPVAVGRTRREVAVVGLCFAAAVFVTYLALGLGAFKAIKIASVSSGVSRGLSVVVGCFALVLGGYSFRDFAIYRRTGKAADMKVKLPERIRLRVRKMVSKGMRGRRLVLGALGLGVVIPLLESVCTGQVYLPTITYVSRDAGLAPKAMGLLILYNLMFIVPLLVVFGLAWFGVTSERLAAFSRRHVGVSKLFLGLVFLGMGAVLIGGVLW